MLNAFNLGQNIKYGIDNKYDGDIKRFANDINCDYEILLKIIDGRRLLYPTKLLEIAEHLDINPIILLSDNSPITKFGNFDDYFNLDRIINMIDDYIEIVERCEK